MSEPRASSRDPGYAFSLLSRLAIEQGWPVDRLARELGLESAPYRALPEAPPLCFFHIAKTGGAAVIAWLRSMFPAAEIAPYSTHDEFAALSRDARRHRLYAGHISGCLFRYLPRKTELVTINREPVARAISDYYWIKARLPIARQQREARILRDPTTRNDPDYMVEAGEFFQRADVLAAMSTDTPAMREFFRDQILRQLARVDGEDVWSELDGEAAALHRLRHRWWQRGARLLKAFSLVGEYDDLEAAVLLLAARRGWPAPPPLPRIHDLGAPSAKLAADPRIRERFRALSPGDLQLYEACRARARSVRSDLRQICGDTTPQAVDRHHAERYFATAARVAAFDVAADAPHNGAGWELPQRDGAGNPYRQFPRGRPVSTLALLDPAGGDYRFFVHIFHASTPDVIGSIRIAVAGAPLQRVRTAWRAWRHGRAFVAEWRLPAETVARLDGRIEFVLQAELAGDDSALRLGRLGCVPALPG